MLISNLGHLMWYFGLKFYSWFSIMSYILIWDHRILFNFLIANLIKLLCTAGTFWDVCGWWGVGDIALIFIG